MYIHITTPSFEFHTILIHTKYGNHLAEMVKYCHAILFTPRMAYLADMVAIHGMEVCCVYVPFMLLLYECNIHTYQNIFILNKL